MSHSIADHHPRAFVTGASAGLGQAFAKMLLKDGVRVWGTARDAARLTNLANEHPSQFTPVALDLDNPDSAEAAFNRAANTAGGSFELVINNAGYGVFGRFDETDANVWERQLGAMLSATMRLTHVALRRMRVAGRGCIVNVSSLAVEFPLPFMSGYNVAKAGLSALSESLIVETRGTAINVIDFRPGDFRTDFNQAMQISYSANSAPSGCTAAAWRALEAHREAAPPPEQAAADLRRAILRRQSGTVRSGSFFQARVAPGFSRVIPAFLRRSIAARYFGL
jgi:short-subunit dehydrogenase